MNLVFREQIQLQLDEVMNDFVVLAELLSKHYQDSDQAKLRDGVVNLIGKYDKKITAQESHLVTKAQKILTERVNSLTNQIYTTHYSLAELSFDAIRLQHILYGYVFSRKFEDTDWQIAKRIAKKYLAEDLLESKAYNERNKLDHLLVRLLKIAEEINYQISRGPA
jgi:hypothetical protein